MSAFGYVAAVRTPEWNYSAVWNKEKYKGTYKTQLYSGKNDPHELHDVAAQFPAVAKDLQAKLDAYIASGWDVTGEVSMRRLAEPVGRAHRLNLK